MRWGVRRRREGLAGQGRTGRGTVRGRREGPASLVVRKTRSSLPFFFLPPFQALGKPNSLWCAFAKFYERHGDIGNARIVFEKASQVREEVAGVDVCGRGVK